MLVVVKYYYKAEYCFNYFFLLFNKRTKIQLFFFIGSLKKLKKNYEKIMIKILNRNLKFYKVHNSKKKCIINNKKKNNLLYG